MAEEVEEVTSNTRRDNSSELKRSPAVVSLGQGKWLDDFIDAFKPLIPSCVINISQRDLKRPIRSSPLHSVSVPRWFSYIDESPLSGSVESSRTSGRVAQSIVRDTIWKYQPCFLRKQYMGAVARACAPTGQSLFLEC